MALKLKSVGGSAGDIDGGSFEFQVAAPIPDGRLMREEKFWLRGKMIGSAALAKLYKTTVDEALKTVVIGWDDVTDDDGNPLPFTPENFSAFLNVVSVRVPSWQKYVATLAGERTGN